MADTRAHYSARSLAVSELAAIDIPALIAPRSAVAQLFENCLRLNFEGVNTIAVPNAAEIPGALFIAEGKPYPVSQGALTSAVIGPVKKLGLIAGITREVEEAALIMLRP